MIDIAEKPAGTYYCKFTEQGVAAASVKAAKEKLECDVCKMHHRGCYGPSPDFLGQGGVASEEKPKPPKLTMPTQIPDKDLVRLTPAPPKAEKTTPPEQDRVREALIALMGKPPARTLPGKKLSFVNKYMAEIQQAHDAGHSYGVIVSAINAASDVRIAKSTIYLAIKHSGNKKRSPKNEERAA